MQSLRRSDAHTERRIYSTHNTCNLSHDSWHTPGTQIHTIHTIHTLHTLHALHTLHTISHTIHTISRTPHAHTHRWVVEGATWVKGEYWREGDWTCIDRHTNNTCFRDLALQVCVFVSYRCVSLCQWPGGLVVVHVGAFVSVSMCGL